MTAANVKEQLQKQYPYKIEMHAHTSPCSPCGTVTPDELVNIYSKLGYDAVVLTVWDEKKLIGLTRVLDDSEMLAQIHYVLVDPDYQGMGIAGKMIEYIKEKYKDFTRC